jgi:hypothetical protein
MSKFRRVAADIQLPNNLSNCELTATRLLSKELNMSREKRKLASLTVKIFVEDHRILQQRIDWGMKQHIACLIFKDLAKRIETDDVELKRIYHKTISTTLQLEDICPTLFPSKKESKENGS